MEDEMETNTFIDGVRGDLQALTAGDQTAISTIERLARALESSLQLRLLDAIGQAALELSDQPPSGQIEVRLAGRDVRFVFVLPEEPPRGSASEGDDAGHARLTLRMPDQLKSRVEQAAGREGISTNAWLVRCVEGGLDRPSGRHRGGRRITGFAQS
jgi:hypothetical protein